MSKGEHEQPKPREKAPSSKGTPQIRMPGEETIRNNLKIRCPYCHQALVVESDLSEDIACTVCGKHFSLLEDRNDSYKSSAVKTIAHFELLEEVGRGAFGTVWKARDTSLDRVVAIKIPRKDQLTREESEHFLREARAAAQLRHPNIVSVHEVGREDDRVYMVSDLVRGVTLEDWLTGKDFSQRDAVLLCSKVADALEHAHSKGVVHRDIKPSNILVNADYEPFVTDFGLARRSAGELTMTMQGQLVGTPAYMSPEQASGDAHHADGRSDVYALGVVLYRLLTGEAPFRGNAAMMMLQILNDEPTSPRKLNGTIPRDLETIVLKCLEKRPDNRYASAADLRDDLQRFLADEPVIARPIGRVERTWRWMKRHPRVAALLCSVIGLLLAVAVISTVSAIRIEESRKAALLNEKRAKENEQRALQAEGAALTAKQGLEDTLKREQEALAESRRTLVDMKTLQGLTAASSQKHAEALSWFADASLLAEPGSSQREESALRFVAWKNRLAIPVFATHFERDLPVDIEFSGDGRYCLARTSLGNLSIIDIPAAKTVELPADFPAGIIDVDWHPREPLLAILSQTGKLTLYSLEAAAVKWEEELLDRPQCLKFSKAGDRLVVGGSRIRVLEVEKREWWETAWDTPGSTFSLSINAAGDRVAALQRTGVIILRKLAPGEQAAPLFQSRPTGSMSLRGAAPRFVGPYLLLLESSKNMVAVDSEAGTKVKDFPVSQGISLIADSHGGSKTAVVSVFGCLVFSAEDLSLKSAGINHSNSVQDCDLSPDHSLLATAAIDSELYLWNFPTNKREGIAAPHQDEVSRVRFSPSGTQLASLQRDGVLRIWQLPLPPPASTALDLNRDEYLTISRDGKYVLPGSHNLARNVHSCQVVSVGAGEPVGEVLRFSGYLNATDFSPDAKRVALAYSQVSGTVSQGWRDYHPMTVNSPGYVEVRDWSTGKPLFDRVRTDSEPIDVAFSPTGDALVVVCGNGQGLVLDPQTGAERGRFSEPGEFIYGLNIPRRIEFHPDGKRFITYGFVEPAAATIRKLPDGGELLRLPDVRVADVEFSRDGSKIAVATLTAQAVVRDCETGEQLHQATLTHPNWVFRLDLSPDEQQVVTASRDWMARIWDWKTGELQLSLPHPNEVMHVEWHPSKPLVVTACRDGITRLWSAKSGQMLESTAAFPGYCHQASFVLDGRAVVFPGQVNEIQLLRWNEVETKAKEALADPLLQARAEVYSGYRIIDHAVTRLDSQAWLERWNTVAPGREDNVAAAKPRSISFHLREAQRFTRSKQWASALWHYQRVLSVEPRHVEALYEAGHAEYMSKRYAQAVQLLSQVLVEDPHHEEALHIRAHCRMAQRQTEGSIEDLNVLLERKPSAHYLQMRSTCYVVMRNYEAALADQQLLLARTPPADAEEVADAMGILSRLADGLSQEMKWDLALRATELMRQVDGLTMPEDAAGHYNRACILSISAKVASAAQQADASRYPLTSTIADYQKNALQHLRRALVDFKVDLSMAESDADLNHLRPLPEYQALMQEVKGK